MRNTILLMFAIGLMPMFLLGQGEHSPEENDQIRAQRAAYITQYLSLTSEEAEHFWPTYSAYETQKREVTRNLRAQHNKNPASDAEALQLIQQRLDAEEQLLALKRTVFDDLSVHISPKKLMLLPKAEREFKQNLVRQLRERRQEQRPNRRG